MDVMRGPPPAPGGHAVGAINSPPPTPPRPAIPPKPPKEKMALAGQRNLEQATRIHSPDHGHVGGHPHSVRSPSTGSAQISPRGDGNLNNSHRDRDAVSPILKSSSAVLTPPSSTASPNINQVSPGSAKPALPPKPVGASNLSSPPLTTRPPTSGRPAPFKFPSQSQQSQSDYVDNAKFVNDNGVTSPPTVNGFTNGAIHSPPPFLRVRPPPRGERGDPLLSPRGCPSGGPSSRPTSSSSFNFSSPIQNLNSANFPSTSHGLNQSGGVGIGLTSPNRLAEIRAKSASLGRNPNFPPPPSESGGGIRGIISRKSATLSKFLPLDLQIGSSARLSSPKPKPNSLNLNPFIIHQKQQQQQAQMSQQQVQGHHHHPSVISFGKGIAFSSPESVVPPPPPPRLKKKLSPVNSLGSPGSPTSPTTPTAIMSSLLAPIPPPPPISPNTTLAMESLSETGEPGVAIYAEVNKQKKWEERKMKEEVRTRSSFDSYAYPTTTSAAASATALKNRPHSSAEVSSPPCHPPLKTSNSSQENYSYIKVNETMKSEGISEPRPFNNDETGSTNNNDPSQSAVVDSWLGKYLNNNPTITNNNTQSSEPERAATPTYQSANTGHIYETIGEAEQAARNRNNHQDSNGLVNNNNNNNNNGEIINDDKEIKKGEDENNLGENQSFLFGHLVIGRMKASAGEENNGGKDHVTKAENDELKIEIIEKEVGEESAEKVVLEKRSSSEPEVTPPPPPPRLSQTNSLTGEPLNNPTYLIPTVVQDVAESTDNPTVNNPTELNTDEALLEPTPPSRTSSILRRRSWNGDRIDSPTPSECSSIASSNSYLPYRDRIERSYNSQDNPNNRDSLASRESWIDESDLSNGALADAESSDVPPQSSVEDIVHMRVTNRDSGISSTASKSFNSRRSRLVNSLFGSFGKGSSSSSGGVGGGKRFSGLRSSGGATGKRGKEKSHTQFYTSESSPNKHSPHKPSSNAVNKWGRQISDSIISTSMISSPVLPKSTSYCGETPHSQKSSVQFSPEVSQTRIIYHDQDSSEDGANENHHPLSPPITGHPVPPLEESLKDNESVSSSESISACGSASGSISGFEDILADLSPKEKKSFYVAREILTSERTFVDVLNLLTLEFPKAIDIANKYHGTAVITVEELNIVLGGLPNLKMVNEDLLHDLEERVSKWKESPKIADILVKKGPFLKLYAEYIKGFQRNSMSLDNFRHKYPLFEQTVKDFESSERCHKLGLKHYMLKPVQRMPQYRLLLEDYLKSLDEESEDYEDTLKGITIVKDVAEHANEAIRLQVNAEKLLDLQGRLPAGTIILKSDRQLIKDGELHKVCRKELQPRFFALTNDCLLCFMYYKTAGSPNDLKLRYELPLAGMRVFLSPAEDYRNEFSVISVMRSFNLVAKSSKDRDEWMKALNNAIHDNIKKRACSTPDLEIEFQLGKEAPVWIQDSRVTMCQLCTAEFTVTFRRHHCRACGKVVCGNCSGNQAPLQYLNNASSRVCDSCYEYLLEDFDKLSNKTANDPDRDRCLLREKFKKVTPNVTKRATKVKMKVPSRLEVNANSSGARISGYLNWKEKEKKNWKRRWFVLIDRVLYIYAASEDIVAIKTVPILGWEVELDQTEQPDKDENQETASFRLKHLGQQPIHFQADSMTTAEKWMTAMGEAVVL